MKAQRIEVAPTVPVYAIQEKELILYRQLALKRLRRIAGWLIRAPLAVVKGIVILFLSEPDLQRQVGPHDRPLSRHEWDKKHTTPGRWVL